MPNILLRFIRNTKVKDLAPRGIHSVKKKDEVEVSRDNAFQSPYIA